MTREEWLMTMTDAVRPLFVQCGGPIPAKVRVSCGWPSRSGLAKNRRTIGQAWPAESSSDGTHETFISPWLETPLAVGETLVHELVHHAVGCQHGHKAPFRRLALAIGLEGKMTATVAGTALAERLNTLATTIGPYPHAKLDGSGRKKQGTRMRKVLCPSPDCGCVARMTRQWLDDVGPPQCGCGTKMVVEESV